MQFISSSSGQLWRTKPSGGWYWQEHYKHRMSTKFGIKYRVFRYFTRSPIVSTSLTCANRLMWRCCCSCKFRSSSRLRWNFDATAEPCWTYCLDQCHDQPLWETLLRWSWKKGQAEVQHLHPRAGDQMVPMRGLRNGDPKLEGWISSDLGEVPHRHDRKQQRM